MGKTSKRFAVGAAFAAAAGYLAGILTAPKSGKETRSDIKEAAQRTYSEAEKQLKEAHTELSKTLEEVRAKTGDLSERAKIELDKAVETANVAKDKARELLSAAHDGEARDEDLDQAVKEAKKAIVDLRKYLTK
mgnify:CR=1 FL=1